MLIIPQFSDNTTGILFVITSNIQLPLKSLTYQIKTRPLGVLEYNIILAKFF